MEVTATGTDAGAGARDSASLQMLMGDFALHESRDAHANYTDHANNPRILGTSVVRFEAPDLDDCTLAEKVQFERETLGFAVSCNEMALGQYDEALAEAGVVPSHRLAKYAGQEVTVAGVGAVCRRHTTKSGEAMMFLTLQDAHGLVEAVLFPDAYRANADVVARGGRGPYLIRGTVQVSGKGRGLGVQPPVALRLADAVTMKVHPVVIAAEVRLLSSQLQSTSRNRPSL